MNVMNYKDIIGQKAVIDSLKNSIANNMVSHAYLFEGPEGIGKKTIAGIYANALLCETGLPEPCGKCRSCVQYRTGNHPDVKMIRISDSSSIGVDDIREFKQDVYVKPYESTKKIYIIDSADKMTIQAQNSLLKVLEEPPAYAVIILISVNSSLLLPTIRSRVVTVKFRIHPYREIEHFLKVHYSHLESQIPFISAFSGGVIGRAKEIAESEQFRDMRQRVFQIGMDFLDMDESKVLNHVSFFVENKHHADTILDILLSWFRDVLFMKELHDDQMVINIDMKRELSAFSQKTPRRSVVRIIDIILDIKRKISMNANFNLAIETMLIQSWEEIHGRGSRSAI